MAAPGQRGRTRPSGLLGDSAPGRVLFGAVLDPLLDRLVPDHEPEAFRLGSVFRAVEVEVAKGDGVRDEFGAIARGRLTRAPRNKGVKLQRATARGAAHARRKFLRYFPGGFRDETYLDWERSYKVETHERWEEALNRAEFRRLLEAGRYAEVAARAVRTEQRSRHSMIFSFEKMALRDAVKPAAGAKRFAEGLYDFLHGPGSDEARFTRWVETVSALPRRQTRVLTWPLITVWGFIAQPEKHIFLKPNVTKIAASVYGFDFHYQSKPNWETYSNLLDLAATIRRDLRDLRPRDMIDLQSFLWVLGSDEYPD